MVDDRKDDRNDDRRGIVVSKSVDEWAVIQAADHTAPTSDARIELPVADG